MRRLVPLLVVLVGAIAGALKTAGSGGVPGDFLRYHRAGRLVVTGRADLLYDAKYLKGQHVYAAERDASERLEEAEFKYAPALAVMMAPLGALPPRPAAVLWGAWNGALIGAMFLAAWRWCGGGVSAWWMLAPLVALLRPVNDNVASGQLNPSAIVPATIGLALAARGRAAAGGALVGVGAVVKYMPAALLVWLAARRSWRALAAAVAAIVAIGVVLPAAVLGPARSIDLAREWIRVRAHVYTSATVADVPGFSAKSFVHRALGDTPYVTNVRGEPVATALPHAGLDGETLRAISIGVVVLAIAAAVWLTRRRRDADRPEAAAIWLAALLVISPEARFPHFLYLALPLVALTVALARGRAALPRWGTVLGLSAAGVLLVNLTAEKLVGSTVARAAEFYCAPGWGAVAFAAALAVVLRARDDQDNGKDVHHGDTETRRMHGGVGT